MKYQEYLKSNRWKKKRKRVKKLYERCMFCGSKENLLVHHRHFETLGRESTYTDLSLFCKKCLSYFPDIRNSELVQIHISKVTTQSNLRKRVREIRLIRDKKSLNLHKRDKNA